MTSAQSFDYLMDKSREFARQTEYDADDVAQAYQYMAMAGWSVEQSTESMLGVLNLASIGMVDLGMASDIVTDAMTSFKNTGITSTEFVDIFAKTITIANTNVEMMGECFAHVKVS